MAKGSKQRGKSAAVKAVAQKTVGSRVRKGTRRQEKQKKRQEVRNRAPVPGSFKLTAQALGLVKRFWRPLGGVLIIYILFNLILSGTVLGNLNTAVGNIKDNLHGGSGKLTTATQGFGSLVTTGTSSSSMQTLLFIIGSLAVIWALRHLLANEHIAIKQSYYNAMGPFIPFVLVMVVIIIQLLPITLGAAVLTIILSTTLGSSFVAVLAGILFVLLAIWSLYMVTSSIFALYIVTLPGMQPLQALRSSRNLVQFRRWQIMRRLLFLPLFVLVVMAIIVVPLILLASFLVTPIFFVLSMLAFLYTHTYLYNFYKRLLE